MSYNQGTHTYIYVYMICISDIKVEHRRETVKESQEGRGEAEEAGRAGQAAQGAAAGGVAAEGTGAVGAGQAAGTAEEAGEI